MAQALNEPADREAQIAECEALLADPGLPTARRRATERDRSELLGLDAPPEGGRQNAPLLAGLSETRTIEVKIEATPDWPRLNPFDRR